MNKKEIAEIKKQLSKKNDTFSRITGCYVSADKKKITEFSSSFQSLEEEERFKYFDIFKKTLSGGLGKNLAYMDFPDEAEEDRGGQELLYRLVKSRLEEKRFLDDLYGRVIEHYESAKNYLILLVYNDYDVPGKGKDGIEMEDGSENVFSYIQMAICPVDLSEPGLSFDRKEMEFHNRIRDWVVGKPQAGFLFPAFDDRAADIHHVLYYSKDAKDLHPAFTEGVLGCRPPMPAEEQKNAFQSVVEEALGDGCSFEAVRNIHDSLRQIQKEAVMAESPDPVKIGKADLRNILEESGAEPEGMENYERAFEEKTEDAGEFMASNVMEGKKFELRTPDVTVSVNPDRTDLVETRIIDGRKCIVIPVSGPLQVSGITVRAKK